MQLWTTKFVQIVSHCLLYQLEEGVARKHSPERVVLCSFVKWNMSAAWPRSGWADQELPAALAAGSAAAQES